MNDKNDCIINNGKDEIKERFLLDYQRKIEKLNRLYKIDSDNNFIIKPRPGFIYLQEIVGDTLSKNIIVPDNTRKIQKETFIPKDKISLPFSEPKKRYFAKKSNIKYDIIEEY